MAALVAACASPSPAAPSVASPVASVSQPPPSAATSSSPAPPSAPISASPASPSVAASPAIDLPAIEPIDGIAGVTAITGIGEADWLALAGNSLWAAGVAPGIGRFDSVTGAQKDGVTAGFSCAAMDVAFDSLWAADCDAATLLRIDPATGTVRATIKLPDAPTNESSIAAGENGVWVTIGGSTALIRLDPKTNKVTTTVDTPAVPGALRAGAGGLWYASVEGKVLRLDPRTGATVATIPAGSVPRFTAIGAGSVWVLNQGDGSVTRIDAKTNAVLATIVVAGTPIDGGDMAFGGGFAWARVSDALVAQIDPATNKVVRRLGNPAGSGSVAADDAAVWISAHDVRTIWRVAL